MLKEQTHDLVPLIDDCVMNDWCGDLSKEDVLDILASVPDECRKCVIEIERAIDEGHLAEAKRVAHRLKGMAGNLGAARLAQIARSLELKSENIEDVSKGMSELRRILDETLAALCSSS